MTTITKSIFGTLSNGSTVHSYTMENASGAKAVVITYGGRLQSLQVPDKDGRLTDVVLGFDTAEGYEKETFYMGALVGRHANRIQNAEITINGTTYKLECNDGPNQTNSLHSGSTGLHCRIWGAQIQGDKLVMTQFSPDGEGGFPGSLQIKVIYSLSDDNALSIHYEALSDADTICNMTNHSYFNLAGCNSGTILDQRLQIFSDRLTYANSESLPTGKIYPAAGTPMDFQQLTVIGDRIDADFDQLAWGAGYDHNWILSAPIENGLRKAAYAVSDQTGITLEAYTDMPGMQFYSGNFLDGTCGKNGTSYQRRSGFCLETQYYPNSPAHPEFPQPIAKAGETWTSTTVFKFGVSKD